MIIFECSYFTAVFKALLTCHFCGIMVKVVALIYSPWCPFMVWNPFGLFIKLVAFSDSFNETGIRSTLNWNVIFEEVCYCSTYPWSHRSLFAIVTISTRQTLKQETVSINKGATKYLPQTRLSIQIPNLWFYDI